MAHFAELDQDNKVIRVIVVNNNELLDNGSENEQKGIDFCKFLYGDHTRWVQCSYNRSFRNIYPSAGDFYNASIDKFHIPQPYPSFTLGQDGNWHAPVHYPTDGKIYIWTEYYKMWGEWLRQDPDPNAKTYPSWTWNQSTSQWDPPIPRPTNPATEYDLLWNEDTQGWGLANVSRHKIKTIIFTTWKELKQYLADNDQLINTYNQVAEQEQLTNPEEREVISPEGDRFISLRCRG